MYPVLPQQRPIRIEDIQQMLSWTPRRFRLAEMQDVLKPPPDPGRDWNLVFPFRESFVPGFEAACGVDHLNFRSKDEQTFCYTFLKNVTDEQIQSLQNWLSALHEAVAIRDCMALSFALDYDRVQGNPEMARTAIGEIRSRAKPYDSIPTNSHREAARQLGIQCVDFLKSVGSYNGADVVVAVPSSDPGRPFSLPEEVAKVIASDFELENRCPLVRTTQRRPALKNLPVSEKLSTIFKTTIVTAPMLGKNVLLVDDLYQSGVTMNCVAMKLIEAGAKAVYGLACEKTCRNDANVSEVE